MDKIEKIRETLSIEIDKKFNAKQYRLMDKDELADIELRVSGGKIGLSISKWDEEVCRIEYFFYWSKDDNESILTDMYKLCIILKQLYVITGNLVHISFHESADEKDVRIELYHDVRKFEVQSIMYILEAYNRVDLREVNQCHLVSIAYLKWLDFQ